MGLLSPVLRNGTGNRLTWWCPGCEHAHSIQHGAGQGPRWQWDGNVERPTFSPSVLVRWSEPNDDPEKFENSAHDVAKVCHVFIRAGRIEFLPDCTHKLAGQTVDIPPWPVANWRDA